MIDSGRNWELFGYDMRNLGRHFSAAWRDLLWDYDSPLRVPLDEAVKLESEAGSRCFQAGEAIPGSTARCRAVLLPDQLVLSRRLRLPLAVEPELEGVLALEVNANSPFSASDTGYGWAVTGRDEQQLSLELVIVSLSAAMAYIGQRYGGHDPAAQEVWVESAGQMIVVRGFGEVRRESLYRQRLLRVGGLASAAALVLLLIGAVGAGFKKLELNRLESESAAVQRGAKDASRMRTVLAGANEVALEVNAIARLHPDVHRELARLTRLLDDSVYVERMTVEGREIDLRGRAADAAALMETLTKQPEYASVSAVSAIRKIIGSKLEQFHLKLQLAEAES